MRKNPVITTIRARVSTFLVPNDNPTERKRKTIHWNWAPGTSRNDTSL